MKMNEVTCNYDSFHDPETIKRYGIPLSEGTGEGKGWVVTSPFLKRTIRKKIDPRYHEREEGNIRHAIQLLSFVIDSAIQQVTLRAGEKEAQIFVALKEILHDPTILDRIISTIKTKNYSAFAAVEATFAHWKTELSKSPLLQISAMVQDLIELEQGLLDALINPQSLFQEKGHRANDGAQGRVILSRHLTPRLVLESRGRHVKGIISEYGGENSHAAILCRALGIPAVAGVAGIYQKRFRNAVIALNGTTGEVAISLKRKHVLELVHNETIFSGKPFKLTGSERLRVFANINLSEHAWEAIVSGAGGIGLYRTELEFLAAGKFLTEEEQIVKYRGLVMAMMGMPVVIRLLDVSLDKISPILHTAGEGIDTSLRGADFLEAHPEILKKQARAIAKIGNLGSVKVLYPMIRNLQQFQSLKRIVEAAAHETGIPIAEHGVMFEIPSACEEADAIFNEADFGSLGTNDLMKYLFGISRESSRAEVQRKAQSPRIWGYITRVARSAQKAGKPLTVCGEMASHPMFLQRFIDLGIHAISVDHIHVKRLRRLLSKQ